MKSTIYMAGGSLTTKETIDLLLAVDEVTRERMISFLDMLDSIGYKWVE